MWRWVPVQIMTFKNFWENIWHCTTPRWSSPTIPSTTALWRTSPSAERIVKTGTTKYTVMKMKFNVVFALFYLALNFFSVAGTENATDPWSQALSTGLRWALMQYTYTDLKKREIWNGSGAKSQKKRRVSRIWPSRVSYLLSYSYIKFSIFSMYIFSSGIS